MQRAREANPTETLWVEKIKEQWEKKLCKGDKVSEKGHKSRMKFVASILRNSELRRSLERCTVDDCEEEKRFEEESKEQVKAWFDTSSYQDLPEHLYFDDAGLDPLLEYSPSEETEIKDFATASSLEEGADAGGDCIYERSKTVTSSCASPVSSHQLEFNSRFESGNLEKVFHVGHNEYNLYLSSDAGCEKQHCQWFYFGVQNIYPGVDYKFNIVNFTKAESLFGSQGGCRPLCYSVHDAQNRKVGWRRIGHDIMYQPSVGKRFCLTFSFCFDEAPQGNIVYFAPCYPYRYSDLQQYLKSLAQDPCRNKRARRMTLCRTLAGNRCDLLTITSFGDGEKTSKRPVIVLTARVHPSESNASWVMQGIIEFLTGPTLDAKILRDKFVFKVIPMLNPDGVIVGNSRCSLAGVDLNRMYLEPDKKFHPTIWHLKSLIASQARQSKVLLFCDIHGHSRKHNVFTYGCEERKLRRLLKGTKRIQKNEEEADSQEIDKVLDGEYDDQDAEIDVDIDEQDIDVEEDMDDDDAEEWTEENTQEEEITDSNIDSVVQPILKKKRSGVRRSKRKQRRKSVLQKKKQQAREEARRAVRRIRLLPSLLQDASSIFALSYCNYKIQKYKESTGRVCIHRESKGEVLSYTLEASLGGCDTGPLAGYHLNHLHFISTGFAFCDALLDFELALQNLKAKQV